MNICTLRTLVYNGWNIANRKALQKCIGKEEFAKLGNAFKKLDERRYKRDLNPVRGDIWIPTGEISLSKRDGEFLLKFPVSLEDIYVRNDTQTFIGKDINLKTVTERVNEFQKKVIDYFKSAKELPESALESKTMRKLYTPEFKAARRMNEDGYYVTTIIDKSTGKPKEAYVQCISKSHVKPEGAELSEITQKTLELENWGIYTKDSQGKYELIGKRSFKIDRENNKLLPDWIDSQGGSDRFDGIGLRAHQIGVERMMQENLETVEICAEAPAFPFHYKSGFRVVPMQQKVPQERINRVLDFWVEKSGINKEILEKAIVYKTVDGEKLLDTQTMENWRKLLYLKNNGKYIMGDTPMNLHGEWLDRWIQMAKSQPILIDI